MNWTAEQVFGSARTAYTERRKILQSCADLSRVTAKEAVLTIMPGTSSSQKTADPNLPFPSLRAQLLGHAQISVGDRAIPDEAWPPRGARNLLFLLLISPRYSLPRDRVLDLLWPESSPEAASNALYKALHALRRVLEPDLRTGRGSSYIATDGDLIRVKPHDGLWVDTVAFEQGLSQAAAQPPEQRRTLLRETLQTMAATCSATTSIPNGSLPGVKRCAAPANGRRSIWLDSTLLPVSRWHRSPYSKR